MNLDLTNVITVSVATAPAGAGYYNTSNLALATWEAPGMSFGAAPFKIYLNPGDVATDWGTASLTAQMANQVFSQSPNILLGNGYFVVLPMLAQIDDLALSGIPASGTFELVFPGGTSAAINWNDATSVIQTKVQAVSGQATTLVTGSLATQDLKINYVGIYGPVASVTITANSLATSAPVAITFVITIFQVAETPDETFDRTRPLVQYFGFMANVINATPAVLGAAIAPYNNIGFAVTRTQADVNPGGGFDLLRSGNLHTMRGLGYFADNDTDSLNYMASYAGRALSTNFSGSLTTSTMNLKDLVGVQPDPAMTQTLYNACKLAGVDIYVSLEGIPKVISFGANDFFDQVYNLAWFTGALKIAAFNYLATTATKIPQTEPGMTGFKGALRQVCLQAITNGYAAPGTWNSPTTFGNQADFLANIVQVGFYIFSVPISQQSQADRVARLAPLSQIALKEAGAIQSAAIIVNINS
jgi:hypothetical protein